MSRFFASLASLSESEDEAAQVRTTADTGRRGLFQSVSDATSSSSEDERPSGRFADDTDSEATSDDAGTGDDGQAAVPVRKSRFEFDSSTSEDEDGAGGRAVRSQAERMLDEMRQFAEAITTAMGDDDASLVDGESAPWLCVDADLDSMLRVMRRASGRMPLARESLLALPLLEHKLSSLAASSSEAVRQLPAAVARAFNALRQKTRKATAEYSVAIEAAQRKDEESSEDEAAADKSPAAAAASAPTELTEDTVLRRLQEILGSRGRKHVDRSESLSTLRRMISLTTGRPRRRMHVLVALVAVGLDAGAVATAGYMSPEAWTAVLGDLEALSSLVRTEGFSLCGTLPATPEEDEHSLPAPSVVRGTIVSCAQRLDDEWTRALQHVDPHAAEYADFLRAEPRLFGLLASVLALAAPGASVPALSAPVPDAHADASVAEFAACLAARMLDHVYAKPVALAAALVSAAKDVFAPPAEDATAAIARVLYVRGTETQRTRALLAHVYWLAMHDRFGAAHALFVQSHVQDALASLDVPSQIAHNRALVALGLAAFRAGALRDAYACLQEVCSTGRPKELLAQGVAGARYTASAAASGAQPADAAAERAERARLVPFHMHMNIEHVEAAFLAAAMLLETPQAAASSRRWFSGDRRLFASRHLRRVAETHARTAGLHGGPPESARERILAASRDLATGSWRSADAHIAAVGLWPAPVRAMLARHVRDTALLAFVLGAAPGAYASLSLPWLAARFDMSPARAHHALAALVRDYGLPATLSPDLLVFGPEAAPAPAAETIGAIAERAATLNARNAECSELVAAMRSAMARAQRTLDMSRA